MEWMALEKHYRAATRQAPSPVEGAIEWDYSRYARALGLTGMPGLHDLPHTGYAVLAAPPAAWDEAADRYDGWAAREGWRFIRLSARATVAVPDPVAYGLGVAVAGRDGLIFARSGRGGAPALGKRPRAPGCSLPLAPGERWLIAGDRVRRRVRSEIATRGLVIQVDEAHRLTASAMTLLAHLIHAHCAWRDRMLSRDAKVYVVFAAPAEHERAVTEMLARFGMNGAPHVARWPTTDRAVADGRRVRTWPHLTAEQEHLWEALHAAPLALAEEDVTEVFGSSARDTAVALVEGGYLATREEDAERCYVPNPSAPAPACAPQKRVVEAIRDRYRARQRSGGHRHLTYAIAELELELGRETRAAAHITRAGLGTTATVPLTTASKLLEAWQPNDGRSAVVLCIAAHLRLASRYECFVEAITEFGWGFPRSFLQSLRHILSTGRTLLDRVLPRDFWAGLSVRRMQPGLVDGVAICAELFARMRFMAREDVSQRFLVASRCLLGVHQMTDISERVRRLGVFLLFRAGVSLRGRMSPGSEIELPSVDVAHLARTGEIPAYAIGTLIYAEACGRTHSARPNFDERDRADALTLVGATGNPADLRIQLTGMCLKLVSDRLRLLGRQLGDESVLVLDSESPEVLRRRLARNLHCLAGARARELSAAALLLRPPAQAGTHSAVERVFTGRGLLLAGDFAAARDNFAAAAAGPFADGAHAALLVASEVLLDRKSLNWPRAERGRVALSRLESSLPSLYRKYVLHLMHGSECLCRRELGNAELHFLKARKSLGRNAIGVVEVLRKDALEGELAARTLRAALAPTLQNWVGAVAAIMRIAPPVVMRHAPLLQFLDYLVIAIESTDVRSASDEDILGVALMLNEHAGPGLRALGRDLGELVAGAASSFFGRLQDVLRGEIGQCVPSAPATRAVTADLALLRGLASAPHVNAMNSLCAFKAKSRVIGRNGHRRLSDSWTDDASTLARVARDAWNLGGLTRERAAVDAVAFLGDRSRAPHVFQLGYERSRVGSVVRVRVLGSSPERQSHVRAETRRSNTVKRVDLAVIDGHSERAKALREDIRKVAACDHPVLIVGETGAGKERVARCIHGMSSRAARPLIVVDCGAISDALLEAELFGHARGAFTGAVAERQGLFAEADGATLLLDEFDSASPRMQAALLRVTENGEYRPVGAARYRRANFRLLATALPGVDERVLRGEIRQDLLFRVSALQVNVPALRERREDIEALARCFAKALGRSLSPRALEELTNCMWPGNVRQLRACIEFSSVLDTGRRIGRSAILKAVHVHEAYLGSASSDVADDLPWRGVLAKLRSRDRFAASDFARLASVSRRSAQRHLAKLVECGLVSRSGAGKSTRYRVQRQGH
jgi:DNA-binding NtrC family response regulator